MCTRKGSGRPKTLEETVERVRIEIMQSPKNKSGNTDSTNNSMAHHEETLDNKALQATTRSGHNGRGQAKAQTQLTCAVSQAERILNMCEIGNEIHMSQNFSL